MWGAIAGWIRMHEDKDDSEQAVEKRHRGQKPPLEDAEPDGQEHHPAGHAGSPRPVGSANDPEAMG